MKGDIAIGLVAVALVVWVGSTFRPDDWQAFVYPDRAHLTDSVSLGHFDTFGACRAAGIAVAVRMAGRADYECGRDCKHEGTPVVCKETRR